ncbi:FliG C-terminal domain-containing protein [Treponema sp. R8-4-B8]
MTVYLRDKKLEYFVISYHNPENADFYCRTIEDLDPKDGSKVFAKVINAETEYKLSDFYLTFDVFLTMTDAAIQKVLREVDSQELAKALKAANKELQDKIFGNMSKREALMLQEDMEYMGPVRYKDVRVAQEKILDIVKKLEADGEIVFEGETA